MQNSSAPAGQSTDSDCYYDKASETLEFEESDIVFYLKDSNRIHLSNAVIIRHFRNDNRDHNCYQDHYRYLHAIFKQYLNHCKHQVELTQDPKQPQQPPPQQGPKNNRRNRTAFIAQFQPFQAGSIQRQLPVANFPTYAVSFEIEMLDDTSGENIIQISYRQIVRRSFLSSALSTFDQPTNSENIRHCLVIERQSKPEQQSSPGSSGNSPSEQPLFSLKPRYMPILPGSNPVDSRLFLVGKHGWLVMFLKNSTEAYLLIENDYLMFPDSLKDVPIFYKRILDMNAANNTEFYYRRTTVDHCDTVCHGMVISKGIMHNEYKEDTFSILGCGNAMINFSYLQQLLSMPPEIAAANGQDSTVKVKEPNT